jgi:hypothetical protein
MTLGIDTTSIHAGNTETARKAAFQADAVRRRFGLRRTAQGILFDKSRNGGEGQHRTCFCGRGIREGQGFVSVYRAAEGGKARYKGLTACGDVWACPSCAAKIAGERRKDLERAMVAAHLGGHHGYLLTLTFPHERGMSLEDLTGRFAKALASFKNSRGYKGFMERHGRIGQIKALEVKHGGNGWHPHVHELVFADRGLLEDTRGLDALRAAWVKALIKQGLGSQEEASDMLAHALDFRGGDDAAAYIAKFGHDEKWGMSSEMTEGMKKIGRDRNGHYTPFELLDLAWQGEDWAAALYREYVAAMKGKRAITWTRGLRLKLLGETDEATDEALAALDDPAPEEAYVGSIDVDRYQELLARRKEGDLIYLVATWMGKIEQAELDEIVDALIAKNRRTSSGFLASVGHGVKKLIGLAGIPA